MKKFKTLLKTELKLSFRGMDMFIFAICMPVVITVILGFVFGAKPAFDGADYTFFQQSFGAVSTIAICAGGVMGLPLVISDYRKKKILKHFKVTPTSPVLILGVQLVIYAIYAVISLVLVFLTSLLFGFRLSGSWFAFMGGWLLVMICMFSIGLMVGGIAKDIKQAGIIASILYFPMLIFSGATLPYEVMPYAMQQIADIMPLTQGIKILKATSLGLPVGNMVIPITIMIVLSIICIVVSLKFFKWE